MLFDNHGYQRSHLIIRLKVGITLVLDCVEKKFSNCIAFGGSKLSILNQLSFCQMKIKLLLIVEKIKRIKSKKELLEKLVNTKLRI